MHTLSTPPSLSPHCREKGMQDFVKEPVLGLLKSVEDLAPEELMAGMARGAGSLLKHSVGGVANSVSLITGGWA